MKAGVPMSPETGAAVGGGLLAMLGSVIKIGRMSQQLDNHEELLRSAVHRSEFDLMNEKIDSIGLDVREIRKSLS